MINDLHSFPSTKTGRTWGRGAASQAETGGWSTCSKGGTKGALAREEEKETGKESEDYKNEQQDEDEGSAYSSKGIKEETKSPMKPTAKSEPQPKTHSKVDDNKGMEGMADEENPFQHKMDTHCMVRKPGGCQTKGVRTDDSQALRPV